MPTKLLCLLLVAFTITSCGNKKEENASSENVAKSKTDSTKITNQVVGVGRVIPEQQIIQVAAEASGILKTIYKNENETVQAGEIIADVSNQIENAELEAARSKITTQNEQTSVANAAVEEYKARLNLLEINIKRLKSLYEKGAETKQAVDNAESEYKTLLATINRAKTQTNSTQSQMAELNANINLAKARLAQKNIKSPVAGKILEWKIRPGEGIMGQQIIAQIAPAGNRIVECEIDEALADKVMIDQAATVRYIGRPETIATGKVYFISDYLRKKSLFSEQSGEAEDRRVRVVKVMLLNADNILLNAKVETVIATKN